MSLDDLTTELKRDLRADESKLRGIVALAIYLKRSGDTGLGAELVATLGVDAHPYMAGLAGSKTAREMLAQVSYEINYHKIAGRRDCVLCGAGEGERHECSIPEVRMFLGRYDFAAFARQIERDGPPASWLAWFRRQHDDPPGVYTIPRPYHAGEPGEIVDPDFEVIENEEVLAAEAASALRGDVLRRHLQRVGYRLGMDARRRVEQLVLDTITSSPSDRDETMSDTAPDDPFTLSVEGLEYSCGHWIMFGRRLAVAEELIDAARLATCGFCRSVDVPQELEATDALDAR